MVKLTVLYGQPEDPAAFEAHYIDRHMPLVARTPGLDQGTATRVIGTPDGSPPPYHRVFEATFPDMDGLQAALGSPEGQAVQADVPRFATGGATILISEG